MDLLILGGTVFLGRHLVEAGLQAGHNLTLFNRGKTNPDLFPELPHLIGDRKADLTSLEGHRWDAVIDTSGYTPAAVKKSVKMLSNQADHYTYISTISVYQDTTQSGLDEKAQTAQLAEGEDWSEVTGANYGPLKALCEGQVSQSFSGDALIIRPGMIVGPYDPTDRFTYWPRRMARGGQVLAPGDPQRSVQLIDVRDLAAWLIEMIGASQTGTYNATGPEAPLSMEKLLTTCQKASDNDSELVWIEDDYLLETGVKPFSELPLWLPVEQNGLLEVDNSRALAAGLTFRPLLDTAKDTFSWDQEKGGLIGRGPAIGPARELALLQSWQAKNQPEA